MSIKRAEDFKTFAHMPCIFVDTDMAQKNVINVHRERLNNWTAKADAIVRTG